MKSKDKSSAGSGAADANNESALNTSVASLS